MAVVDGLPDSEPLCERRHGCGDDAGTVEVRALSGEIIATMTVSSSQETAGALRDRLLKTLPDEESRRRYGQSWLVSGCSVLPDGRPLGERLWPAGGGRPPSDGGAPPVLTLVCARPSSLAEHLARSGFEADGVVDVADSVFQAEHAMSMRHRPTAQDAARNLSPDLRAQVVDWLAIACNAVGLDDQLLHGAVLTLDRYCACHPVPIDESRLLRLSLAALCTEMKLATSDDFPYGSWQRLILHLGQGREGLQDIFGAERDVLRRLGFSVWVPTPLTFLRGLGLRLCRSPDSPLPSGSRPGPASPDAALQLAFARMFVELTLYDVFLQYRFPPAILAAAALGAAIFAAGAAPHCLQASRGWWNRVAPGMAELAAGHETLLEDLTSYCPSLADARGAAQECERLILEMWLECSQGTSQWTDCYVHLCHRHSTQAPPYPGGEDGSFARVGILLREASAEAALQSLSAFSLHR